jgi:hypothetical protein
LHIKEKANLEEKIKALEEKLGKMQNKTVRLMYNM